MFILLREVPTYILRTFFVPNVGYHNALILLCHTLRPTLRALWSFHTLSFQIQSTNDSNNHLVTRKLQITKFLFRVIKHTIILNFFIFFYKKKKT